MHKNFHNFFIIMNMFSKVWVNIKYFKYIMESEYFITVIYLGTKFCELFFQCQL